MLDVAEVPAPVEVAERLGTSALVPIVVRRRLFWVDDERVARCDSYYDAELVRNSVISKSRLITGGALRVIEDPAGARHTRTQRAL